MGSHTTSTGRAEPSTPQVQRTLVCRMGGEMRWSLLTQFDVMQTQMNNKNVRVPVIVALFDQLFYARNTTVVKPDGSNLLPGQCGFTDRPMTATDPNMVIADNDDFMLQQNVLWGNGSTIRSEATMFGGSLSFQNKQAFTMQVTLINNKLRVVAGTKPKALK
jgi:hypothetical protein